MAVREYMATHGGVRSAVATGLFVFLVSCSSSGLDQEVPAMGAATGDVSHDDSELPARLVTVFLTLDTANGYQPVYSDRIIVAQLAEPAIAERAEGKMLVQGIDTVVIGSSCEDLLQRYSEMSECKMVESMEVDYGEIQATATTDYEGFASLEIGHGDYRVSLRSWPTIEDEKCHWSGSAVIKGDATSIGIPLLVFCE